MRKQYLSVIISFLLATICLVSCSKDNNTGTSSFLGKWKTSYGDTIAFVRVNGKNMLRYNQSMSPTFTMPTNYEYTYSNNKLGVKDGLSGLAYFHFYQSFRWLEEGRSFEVQGIEWFPFISSTLTFFTFTKIP